jgi:hypothetical protein
MTLASPLRRRILTVGAVASRVAAYAVAVLWLASYGPEKWRAVASGTRPHYFFLISDEGRICLYWKTRPPYSGGSYEPAILPLDHEALGFGFTYQDPADGGDLPRGSVNRGIAFPHWFAMIALLTFPLALRRAARRSARGARSGRCIQCGYDLRASPTRCPECGVVAAPSPRGSSRQAAGGATRV